MDECLVNQILDYPRYFTLSVYLCAWHTDSHGSKGRRHFQRGVLVVT